jgi:hypothetical protein
MTEVSVVIPLYGAHPGRQSVARVAAAWRRQTVDCEVVVATAGDLGVDIPAARVVVADPGLCGPGLLRNVGVEHARGARLYLSDADVAPLGPDFLARVSRLPGVFAQPWMYRSADFPDGVPDAVHGYGAFCFVRPGDQGRWEHHPGERFVWKRMNHGGVPLDTPTLTPPPDLPRDPTDQRDWRVPFHWGGVLLDRALFTAVGGYCPGYRGWGNEDDDLLIKVAARAPVTRGWQVDPRIACVHFEHAYPYPSTPERQANSALYARRLAAGAAAMVAADRS